MVCGPDLTVGLFDPETPPTSLTVKRGLLRGQSIIRAGVDRIELPMTQSSRRQRSRESEDIPGAL